MAETLTSSQGPAEDWHVNQSVDGLDWDRCPCCSSSVEPQFRKGDPNGGIQHWSMYHHDPQAGGCGATWTRTSRQGAEADAAQGVHSKWLTGSADRNVTYSLPSRAFRNNYDRIDWSK